MEAEALFLIPPVLPRTKHTSESRDATPALVKLSKMMLMLSVAMVTKLGSWFIKSGDDAPPGPDDVDNDSVTDDAGNHGGRDGEVGDGAADAQMLTVLTTTSLSQKCLVEEGVLRTDDDVVY